MKFSLVVWVGTYNNLDSFKHNYVKCCTFEILTQFLKLMIMTQSLTNFRGTYIFSNYFFLAYDTTIPILPVFKEVNLYTTILLVCNSFSPLKFLQGVLGSLWMNRCLLVEIWVHRAWLVAFLRGVEEVDHNWKIIQFFR